MDQTMQAIEIQDQKSTNYHIAYSEECINFYKSMVEEDYFKQEDMSDRLNSTASQGEIIDAKHTRFAQTGHLLHCQLMPLASRQSLC